MNARSLLASLWLASACGSPPAEIPDNPATDSGSEADAGAPDGGQADSGTPGEDGGLPDGGPRVGVTVTPVLPQGARRGPILLHFRIADPDGEVALLRLERREGAAWVPASVLFLERAGLDATLGWDSFADFPLDGWVELRLLAPDPDGDGVGQLTLEVRNRPDTDRLVLVAHRLVPLDGGGASPDGTGLSSFTWSADGGVVGQRARIEVGAGPGALRSAPHGRAVAVLEETDGTVSLVETPLDARPQGVRRGATLQLPHGSPADLRWSPDGRYLFVAGGLTGTKPPVLWRFEPAEDLSTLGPPGSLASLPGPPLKLEVDRASGRLLVACGSATGGPHLLLLLSPAGVELARLSGSFGVANALALSPQGDQALLTSVISGPEVFLFRLGPASIVQEGNALTSLPSPSDALFHPLAHQTGQAALISNLEANSVTPLFLQAGGGTVVRAALGGISLAAEMDLIERGGEVGRVFVSALIRVRTLELHPDGTVSAASTAVDFGSGVRNITHGMAVQR